MTINGLDCCVIAWYRESTKNIDYQNCHVPRSMYTRKYTHININEMMFQTMSHPLKYTPDKLTTNCLSVDCIFVLMRSRIASVFHTVFVYENFKYQKEERARGYIHDHIKIEEATVDDMDNNSVAVITKYLETKMTYL